jgi:hypothetical protein
VERAEFQRRLMSPARTLSWLGCCVRDRWVEPGG